MGIRINKGTLPSSLVTIQLSLLTIQFITGMIINLFAPMNIQPYSSHPFMMGYMMYIFNAIPLLPFHMMLGIIIGMISLAMLVISAIKKDSKILVLSLVEGMFVLIAGISGIDFILSGLSNNYLSFIMSIGFIGSLITLFLFSK
ncbi:hypothetical protein [Caldisphaera sp.]|jgi:hypothetical protein|uniref:hypothetical protein n=1 Tax=Caldisphaera sp. TaxID=2060322 RepID=UPI003979A17A